MDRDAFIECLRAIGFSPSSPVGELTATSVVEALIGVLQSSGLNVGQSAVVAARLLLRVIEVSDACAVAPRSST